MAAVPVSDAALVVDPAGSVVDGLGDYDAVDPGIQAPVALAGRAQPYRCRAGGVRDRGQSGVAGEGGLAPEALDVGHLGDDPGRRQFSAALQGDQVRSDGPDGALDPATQREDDRVDPDDVVQLVPGEFSDQTVLGAQPVPQLAVGFLDPQLHALAYIACRGYYPAVGLKAGRQEPRWILVAALGAVAALIVGLVLWRPWAADTTEPSNPTTSAEASNRSGGQSSASRGPAVPSKSDPDLGLDVPISRPACDGTGIVILDSATTPGRYQQDVGRALANNPGASYLRTDLSCPSLRQQSDDGNPIYAVYRPAGTTKDEICATVAAAGPGAYGRWLDTTSDPVTPVECPKTADAAADVVDVDPANYLNDRGFHLWAYSTSGSECAIYSVHGNTPLELGVWCFAAFPQGTPSVFDEGWGVGPPNIVRIVPPDGPRLGISEGGPIRGKRMMPNRRITVGKIACTTLPNDGVDCIAPTGRFRIEHGVLTTP